LEGKSPEVFAVAPTSAVIDEQAQKLDQLQQYIVAG
jgi:hypothetical protein